MSSRSGVWGCVVRCEVFQVISTTNISSVPHAERLSADSFDDSLRSNRRVIVRRGAVKFIDHESTSAQGFRTSADASLQVRQLELVQLLITMLKPLPSNPQQRFLQPNPNRVGELREIGKAIETPGWFRKIWPELRTILAAASGPFSTIIPEVCIITHLVLGMLNMPTHQARSGATSDPMCRSRV
ncbi:hypothetical protein BKA83DRAFT_4179327 [Pisolithus microcarpus]|nr:hypothetical protein BKA83DRAFT_4179327 [Pisolithus microcarpus]